MAGRRFSWASAGRAYLLALASGAAVTVICLVLDGAHVSEGESSVFPFLLGIFVALLDLASTFPLRQIVEPQMTHGLWRLVLPNFALWGVLHAVILGFLGFGETCEPSKPREDNLRVFRMHDGDD